MNNIKIKTKTCIAKGITHEGEVRVFKGIPYAKPPEGALRWLEPQPLPHSEVEIDANEYGSSSIQPIDEEIEIASLHKQSENCLSLNIWTKYAEGARKPVMVFIHGGSYVFGGTCDPMYNGYRFAADQDVVFVSINYRLGILGFLDLSEFDAKYKNSGRLGLLDQVRALTWVKENISFFGGDEDNITIFGESCGGGSVSLLMTMPDAKGLFNKVIAQSGSYNLKKNVCLAKQMTREIMIELGCERLSELKRLSADRIRDYLARDCPSSFGFKAEIMFAPSADGQCLPVEPLVEIQNGCASDVKFMTGTTANEFFYWKLFTENLAERMPLFLAEQLYVQGIILHHQEQARKDFFEHRKSRDYEETVIGYSDEILFRIPTIKMADAQSEHNDTYVYYFTWESNIPGLKSCHALELPFVFNTLDAESSAAITGEYPPEKLARDMQSAWASFAKSGDPSNENIPKWDKYDSMRRKTMIIDEEWQVANDPEKESREIISKMFIG